MPNDSGMTLKRQPKEEVLGTDTVASKLITDRHFCWKKSNSSYRYRIVLPDELISRLHYKERSVEIIGESLLLQIQILS